MTWRRPYTANVAERGFCSRELQLQEAPTELILRHMEIKFIMRSPEFRRVVEMWREICSGITARSAPSARPNIAKNRVFAAKTRQKHAKTLHC